MEKVYDINEMFLSIQGEGQQAGRAAWFIRFAGCNLQCPFCDTPHEEVKHRLTEQQIVQEYLRATSDYPEVNLIVMTGGEPLIHQPESLARSLMSVGAEVSVETNGTVPVKAFVYHHIVVSPKVPREECQLNRCDTLKLLYPYLPGCTPEDYRDFSAKHKCIQPVDTGLPSSQASNMIGAYEEVLHLGKDWRLNIQLHKVVGVK